MIYGCWLVLNTGLPLWSKQFVQAKQKIDHTLIAGLLTATKSFANQVIGSELKDIVLKEGRLHTYPILNRYAAFTIHTDIIVENSKLDSILENAHISLHAVLNENNIELDDLESASFKKLQKIIEVFQPILDNELCDNLNELKDELILIHDETIFDQEVITLLKEVPNIVPFLVTNQCSFTIRDLKTQKLHFQQLYSRMDPKKVRHIKEIIIQMEYLNFMDDDLIGDPGYIILGGTATAIFKIEEVENILFIIFKDNFNFLQFNQFQKLVTELQKRVNNLYL